MEIRVANYYDYVHAESIATHLLCLLCQKPLVEPVVTPCRNTFCRHCIEQSLDEHHLRCPSCPESHLKRHSCSLTDETILEALDRLQVICKLCGAVNLERAGFSRHICETCPKAVVTCSTDEKKCPWIGLREELPTHLTTCSYRTSAFDLQAFDDPHGKFFPYSNINLQQRQLQNHDMAIAVKSLLLNRRCTCIDLFRKGISSDSALIIASVLHNDSVLETFSLRNNLLCDSGVQFLAHALSTNSHLKRLDLNDNAITDTGVRLLAEMLKSNRTLIKLTLSFNRITSEGVGMLMDVLANNNTTLQWLCLAENPAIDDSATHSILGLIRNNRSLTTLNLAGCHFSWWTKQQIYVTRMIHSKSALDIMW